MRTSTLFAVTLLSALGLSLAAQADPAVSVYWQSTGSAEISVLPGTTVTADFYVTLSGADGLDAYQLSIGWDPGELSYVGFSLVVAPPPPWTPPGFPAIELCPDVGKCEGVLAAVSSVEVYAPTTFYIGSISFVATPTDVGGPIDVWAYDTGAFGTDFMSAGGTPYMATTFAGASVDLIPEPATSALLALGLVALAAARRRRRLNS